MRAKASTTRSLHSGELARLADISTDTLRFYERRGLLPLAPRTVLARVRLIRGALSIGFSVAELTAILRERDHGGAPCRRVRELAAHKLATLEDQLRDLQSWRRELRKTLAGWDRALKDTPRGKRAGLLEAFVATHPKRQSRSVRLNALAHGKSQREKQQ